MKGFPVTVRIWCDALLATDMEQLEWLAKDRQARAVINDRFIAWNPIEGREMQTFLISWFIRVVPSLYRVRFLRERCDALLSEDALASAIASTPVQWDLVYYLESQGIRHTNMDNAYVQFYKLATEFGHQSREALECALMYPNISSKGTGVELLVRLARCRRERAQKAAVVVIGLYRKQIGKDVARLIGRQVMAPRTRVDPIWGDLTFGQRLGISMSTCMYILAILLVLCTIVYGTIMLSSPLPQPPFGRGLFEAAWATWEATWDQ